MAPDAPPPGHREDRAGGLTNAYADGTARYFAGRERVLGQWVWVPLADPAIGAEHLAEGLGGRQQARRWLRGALDALGPSTAATARRTLREAWESGR